jgi:diacylglycerol kinase (ATP)
VERSAGNAVAVVSEGSRRGPRAVSRLIAAYSHPRRLEVRTVRSSDEAVAAARDAASSAGTVIAVGGDGTVSDVATGMLGTDAVLGIVATGSTNIVARGLGIPASPEAAIRLLAGTHRVRAIDVGRCGDRCFLHMAGAGFDAEIFRGTSRSLKRSLGWLAYLPAAARALRTAPALVRVTVDGTVLTTRSPLVLVANGGAIVTPALALYPDITVDDGWLDILVFSTVTPPQIVAALGLTGLRRLHRSPHVRRLRGREVRIEADPPLPIQLDGDVRGETPRTMVIVPRGLKVIVP